MSEVRWVGGEKMVGNVGKVMVGIVVESCKSRAVTCQSLITTNQSIA